DGEAVTGQRGRQRAILREGVYAINPVLFVVMTDGCVYRLGQSSKQELQSFLKWQEELRAADAFHPVVIGQPMEVPDPLRPDKTMSVDSIGIVTVQDGPWLPPGEIIAP